jgi:NAD(P)-dependent dehydrogenase (short-subunit alcohol dehydrogenase family)
MVSTKYILSRSLKNHKKYPDSYDEIISSNAVTEFFPMKKNRFDLSGRIALVTGASSGFGEQFSKVLAEAGAEVIACARRVDRLQNLVTQIEAAGGRAHAIEMDVTDTASVDHAFAQIDRIAPAVDILVNNAGISVPGLFVRTSEDDWDRQIETNLKSVWRISRRVVDRMRAYPLESSSASSRSIINIASILGLAPGKALSLYAISKAGVVQLTKNMALELARDNIRVNALCPGYFKTELNGDYFETDKGREFIARTLAKRWGEMEEISGPLLLLASDAGSFINGTTLTVDGGHMVDAL